MQTFLKPLWCACLFLWTTQIFHNDDDTIGREDVLEEAEEEEGVSEWAWPKSVVCWINEVFFCLHCCCCCWCQFHQHFTCGFFYKSFACSFYVLTFCALTFFWQKNIGANALIKCWWNQPLMLPQLSSNILFSLTSEEEDSNINTHTHKLKGTYLMKKKQTLWRCSIASKRLWKTEVKKKFKNVFLSTKL